MGEIYVYAYAGNNYFKTYIFKLNEKMISCENSVNYEDDDRYVQCTLLFNDNSNPNKYIYFRKEEVLNLEDGFFKLQDYLEIMEK